MQSVYLYVDVFENTPHRVLDAIYEQPLIKQIVYLYVSVAGTGTNYTDLLALHGPIFTLTLCFHSYKQHNIGRNTQRVRL